MRNALLAALLAISACTYSIHDMHYSGFTPGVHPAAGRPVEASGEQFVLLGLAFDTAYVDKAYTDLLATCPGGSLQGITSRLSTSHGFLSWTNKLVIKARCIDGKTR